MTPHEAAGGLTADRLRDLLSYDHETGVFKRLVGTTNQPAGTIAGTTKPSGYRMIDVEKLRYRAHRLAWLYVTGKWPEEQIDHRNGLRDDNRWCNLRAASNRQNAGNRPKNKNNTSGYKGVYWASRRAKWAAKLNAGRRQVHLGFYADPAQAGAAYERAARESFGEFGRA